MSRRNTDQSQVLMTVIMASHNDSEVGIRALRSVSMQRVKPHEVIIAVDDSGAEHMRRWQNACAESPVRCKIIETSSGGRPAHARNQAAKLATGTWLAFLDSDDLWYPWKLTVITRLQARRDDCGFFFHAMTQTAKRPKFPWFPVIGLNMAPRDVTDFTTVLHRVPFSSLVVRTTAFRDVGGFEEGFDFRSVEDSDLIRRLLENGQKCGQSRIPAGNYCLRPGSISSTVDFTPLDTLLKSFFNESLISVEDPPPWYYFAKASRLSRQGDWVTAQHLLGKARCARRASQRQRALAFAWMTLAKIRGLKEGSFR